MPKIIGQAEQQRALKNIRASLKELAVTNKFLEGSNPSGEFTFSYVGPGGEHYASAAFCADKANIDSFVKAYKDRIVDDMMQQAEENRIELEPEDLAVFGRTDY